MRLLRAILYPLLCLGLAATLLADPAPQWSSTWEARMRQSEEQGQPLLIFFTAPDCAWSARMESALAEPQILPLLSSYLLLRLSTATHTETSLRERIRSTPTLLVIHPEGLTRKKLEGFHEQSTLTHFLQQSLEAPPPPEAEPGTDSLSQRLRTLGTVRNRTEHIRALLAEDPFPAAALVAALESPALAVRLGALEVLEAHTGRNHGFDPWLPPAEQEETLSTWQQWSGSKAHHTTTGQASAFTATQLEGYITELYSTDLTRSRRALDRLSEGGTTVADHLEHSLLTTSSRLKQREINLLRQASLAARLRSWGVERASALARKLITGNPDTRITALETLGQLGPRAQPLIARFLDDNDGLVREATVEILVAQGGAHTLPTLSTRWSAETNTDVRVGILRAISEINHHSTVDLLNLALLDDSEDIRTLALEYLSHLDKLEYDTERIRACLSDDSWRVRAAALETAQRLNLRPLADSIATLVHDEDEFVRTTALSTLALVSGTLSQPTLVEVFDAQPERRLTILEIYRSNDWALPDTFIRGIRELPSDKHLELAGILRNLRAAQMPLASAYLDHPNEDLRIAALISAATSGSDNSAIRQHLANTLTRGTRAERMAILDHFTYEAREVPSLATATQSSSHTQRSSPPQSSLFSLFFSRSTPEAAPTPDQEPESPQPLRPLKDAALPLLNQSGDSELGDAAALFITRLGSPEAIDILKTRIPDIAPDKLYALLQAIREFREPWIGDIIEAALPHLTRYHWGIPRAYFSRGMFHENLRFLINHAQQQAHDPNAHRYLQNVPFHNLREADEINATRTLLQQSYDDPEYADLRVILLIARSQEKILQWPHDREWLIEQTRSDDPLIRRAAWHGISQGRPVELELAAGIIAGDSDPRVREVLPAVLQRHNAWWQDHYSEKITGHSSMSSHARNLRQQPISADTLAVLDSMATSDPMRYLRLRAIIAQADIQGSLQDIPFFVETFGGLDETDPAKRSIGYWVSAYIYEKFHTLGPEHEALLPWVESEGHSNDYQRRHTLEQVRERIRSRSVADGIQTGKAIDPEEPSPANPDELPVLTAESQLPSLLEEPAPAPDDATAEAPPVPLSPDAVSLKVVFFTQTGCADCARVREYFHQLQPIFPELEIETHNVRNMDAIRYNEHLSEHFGVPMRERLVAPAVFAASGALVRDDVTLDALSRLLASSHGRDPAILTPPVELESTVTASRIEERFRGMTLAVVLTAGLLDGLNPCAFATIIFFLSYLQIARRSPIQILQVGLAFVLGIFLTYFALGLGLLHLITRLTALQSVALAINWILAVFVLIICILSIRDGILCLRGRLKDTALQLPRPLKRAVNALIRTGVRHSRFIIAAFFIGMGISVLELACTGQVYLPTITFVLQSGTERTGALGYLLLYNIAFILPLLIVIALAWKGLTSSRLTTFFQKHVALVKFANAALFAALFAFFLIVLLP